MKHDIHVFLRSAHNPWTATCISRTRITNFLIYSSARYHRATSIPMTCVRMYVSSDDVFLHAINNWTAACACVSKSLVLILYSTCTYVCFNLTFYKICVEQSASANFNQRSKRRVYVRILKIKLRWELSWRLFGQKRRLWGACERCSSSGIQNSPRGATLQRAKINTHTGTL